MAALDVARAGAVFGMVIVNVGPVLAEGPASWPMQLLYGRASVLFILLAGLGVVLLAGTRSAGRSVTGTLLWRAAVLFLLGLALQPLPHEVNVILTVYSVLFLVAIPGLRVPSWAVLTTAGVLTVVGPLVWIAVNRGVEEKDDAARFGDSPGQILASVTLTGPYPVIVWAVPFLVGMWVGQRDLRSRSTQWALVIYGAIAGLAGYAVAEGLQFIYGAPEPESVDYDRLLTAGGHSHMPLWLVSATGTAVLAVGLLLLVVPHLGRVTAPFEAVGRMPLTAYTAHLLLIAFLVRPGPDEAGTGLLASVGIIVVLVVLSLVWSMIRRTGPLEYLMRPPPLPRLRRPPSFSADPP